MAPKTKWIEGVLPQDSLEKVARLALQGRLELVWHYLPRAAEGPHGDLENVHQLRVASRRAMAAMQIFESLLPSRRGKQLAKKLKRVRQAAGDARDLDVFAARLAERIELEPDGDRYQPLLHHIRYARQQAQGPIEKIYDKLAKRRYPRRVAALIKRVRLRDEADQLSRPTYGSAARKILRIQVEDFFAAAAGDFSDYAALHAFRIQGKQLRYVMEIFAAAFDPWFRKELYRQVETLQEKLGEINDHATAQQRLESWLADDGCTLRPALEALIAEEKQALEESREQFLNWWTPERRDELRRGFARAVSSQQAIASPRLELEDERA